MKGLNIIIILILLTLLSCDIREKKKFKKEVASQEVFMKEPDDSANFKHLKFNFYLDKNGQLFERKAASAKNSNCNCLYQVFYDSIFRIYTDDTIIDKKLSSIVDINSYIEIDSTDYSKDKNFVFYYYENSDGGVRLIVDKANPKTFKRLCEYRWGIDDKFVYYSGNRLKGLNLKELKILKSIDTSNKFVDYIKDNKNVYFENDIVQEADSKTFKLVNGKKWDAEDKHFKYEKGNKIK